MNKKTKILAGTILSILMLSGLFSVGAPKASAMTCNSATFDGYVYTAGNTETHARFTYGTDSNVVQSGGGTATQVQYFYSDSEVQQFVTGLSPSTTYYDRLEISSVLGTNYGAITSFTTPACENQNQNQNHTGTITASPNPCIIPAGQNVCTSGIGWSTAGGVTHAVVYVDGSEMADATSGNASANQANWITAGHTFVFTLYDYSSGSRGAALDSVSVTGQQTPTQTCQDSSADNYHTGYPCHYPQLTCQDSSADNYHTGYPCHYPQQTCQDQAANNYHTGYPCTYPPQTCQDSSADNYHTGYPCHYPPLTCQDSSADNYHTGYPCHYPPQTCQDPNATNYRVSIPCTYIITPTTCQDPSATNYHVSFPCTYPVQTCQDPSATNYRGALPCTYQVLTCQDPSAINYHGTLPCRYNGGNNTQPTVNIYADDTSISDGDSTRIHWDSSNADTCRATGGTNGWSGSRNTSGSFNTGDLSNDETYRISCSNNYGSADDSVTVRVDDNNNDNNNNEPDVTTRSATNVNFGSATLNGTVDGNGTSTRAWFEYGINYNLGYTTQQSSYGSGSTSYSRSVNNLDQNTTYYFRAVAENSEGTVYGNILSFTTNGSNGGGNIGQPVVVLSADSYSVGYNGSTTLRWYTNNSTNCTATGGSAGWAGPRSIGPGSFYTGSLTSTSTYILTCTNGYGSATDSVTVNVGGQTVRVVGTTTPRSSLVIINSSIDRNQPIVPTLDNTKPRPGDEINLTVNYQNIGTGSITNLVLQLNLPPEVVYISSNPGNPNIYGNNVIFNLGTLRANGQGTVVTRVRVLDNIAPGTVLNFPATLSYVDPTGAPQSVSANVTAQIINDDVNKTTNNLGASVFGTGFFPSGIFGWLLLIILILLLVLLVRYLFDRPQQQQVYAPTALPRRTTTTVIEH